MLTISPKNSFKRALLAMVVLLVSVSATAMTIQGKAKVLDYEESKGQPKQCLELPVQLDSIQQYYGDFVLLEAAQKGGSSVYSPQPIALTTNSNILCFNELRYGHRYQVTFREGFPAAEGNTFRQTLKTAFSIPDLAANI